MEGTFRKLLAEVAPRTTPEFGSVVDFAKKDPHDVKNWHTCVPHARSDIPRVSSSSTNALQAALTSGEGCPVVITDAFGSTQGRSRLNFAQLREQCASVKVRANDRAPARHADALPGGGGPQRSVVVTFAEYCDYLHALPESLEALANSQIDTPFYVNGWRAFVEVPSLLPYCPAPEFTTCLDDTVSLLRAVDAQLFKTPTEIESTWCRQVDANLTKLFIGPPGTVTRLHFDAGEAHGWLGQLQGRKLFVLAPPSASSALKPLPSEVETVQSDLDPLLPDLQKWPEYAGSGAIAAVVHPGEAILVPQGWWHYAVALDRSITLQRNFYHAASNADGLVKMVLKTAAVLKQQRHAS